MRSFSSPGRDLICRSVTRPYFSWTYFPVQVERFAAPRPDAEHELEQRCEVGRRPGNDQLCLRRGQPLLAPFALPDTLEGWHRAPSADRPVAQDGLHRGEYLPQAGRVRSAGAQQLLACLVEQFLIHLVAPDTLESGLLQVTQEAIQPTLRVCRPLSFQIAQRRLGERAGWSHAVDVGAVDRRFAVGALFFREIGVVSASALSNALAADRADNPEHAAVGAGDDFEGHLRFPIR